MTWTDKLWMRGCIAIYIAYQVSRLVAVAVVWALDR